MEHVPEDVLVSDFPTAASARAGAAGAAGL